MRFPAVVTLPSLHVLCMSTGFNEFYRSLCQDAIPETLKGRDLYERYKRFHGAGSFKKLMTETAFGIENKRVGGLIKIPTAGSGRVRYKLDKAKSNASTWSDAIETMPAVRVIPYLGQGVDPKFFAAS